ncbi:MAG: hypothetical protein JSS04_25870 [Proteobacteria bacterium]|nr:hypothetical protein [Pseudomonadota bacterium]
MAQEREPLVGVGQIGGQRGEAGDRQGEQPKDRLVAKPEGDRIDDQEEERRALDDTAPGSVPGSTTRPSLPEAPPSVSASIVSAPYHTRLSHPV